MKRIFDIAFSSCVLILGSPVYFLIAGSIFLSSPSAPIIFAHERIGLNGKRFKCYKFRTMVPNAAQKLAQLLQSNPLLKTEWEQHYQLKSDPRVTLLGRVLRKTSLDELPQFWNVLRGDLSVVGPRPITQEEVDKYYATTSAQLLSVRPGITGLAQISGRGEITHEKKAELNLLYVKVQSFFLDLKIILQTLPVVLSARGAH
jgi:undecaprenyl-phosphate galactose phosphotransferase